MTSGTPIGNNPGGLSLGIEQAMPVALLDQSNEYRSQLFTLSDVWLFDVSLIVSEDLYLYKNAEMTDMHFMYGLADGNLLQARRLYIERFP